MRISDWSSDVCSSDLDRRDDRLEADRRVGRVDRDEKTAGKAREGGADAEADGVDALYFDAQRLRRVRVLRGGADRLSEAGEADEGPQREAGGGGDRSAAHTSASSHYCVSRMPSSACNKKTTH